MGREVVAALVARDMRVIAADVDTICLGPLFADMATTVQFDFLDPSTWRDTVRGAQHMFLIRPSEIYDVDQNLCPFIDFAVEHGVDHVIFLSVPGGENRMVPHRRVEQHLRDTGVHHTNLRPGAFAQNLQSAYRRDIVEEGRIYVPAGHKPVNWIDMRDVADLAAVIFQTPEPHRGKSYTLYGPGPVPWTELTNTLSSAIGRPVRYEPASILGYVRHLSERGIPPGRIASQTIRHVLLRFGLGAAVDSTLEELLGRPCRTISEYIADHVDVWRTPISHTHEGEGLGAAGW